MFELNHVIFLSILARFGLVSSTVNLGFFVFESLLVLDLLLGCPFLFCMIFSDFVQNPNCKKKNSGVNLIFAVLSYLSSKMQLFIEFC